LNTGTPFPGKTAPHHASFTAVLEIGGKKERVAFTRKARKGLISSSKVSISVIDPRDVKERTESWFIKQSITIEILP
jgi:hypothetical protein